MVMQTAIQAQDYKMLDSVRVNGRVYPAMVMGGDTLILAELDDVQMTSLRSFSSREEYRKYLKYRKYAAAVYPYAKDAVNILKTVEERTAEMPKSRRKKYIKQTYKQLENNFKKQLMGLYKTQGLILIKMIEKEMDQSFYDIIRDKRNFFTAFYWQNFGKLYGYDLKRGYVKGDDPILDAVLRDFDVSYDKNASGMIHSK